MFDVAVYGATAAGVMAAIAAAQEGARVVLLEPGQHVGGMVSGGLGHTDYGDPRVIGGLALEFYERVARTYGAETWGLVGPEPHVAEQIFRDWLAEARIEVAFDARLDRVIKDGRRITELFTEQGVSYAAQVFVDAGYEGDLLARAGVAYAVGRESVADYGESWAGRRPILPGQHNLAVPVSPFVAGEDGELLPLIHRRPMTREGEGDGGVQSYCFRLCLTQRPEKQLPIPQPDGYDAAEFELLRRYLAVANPTPRAQALMSLVPNLPNGKCDVNSIGPISTNLLDGSSWEYPDADYGRRRQLWDRHLHYTQGLLYFLTNDPSVPAGIRQTMEQWGLCRDEFVDTNHWPHQLYVREARRMRGEYWMTQADLEARRVKYDAVGMGSYNIDIREVQRTWIWVSRHHRLEGETYNEGYLSVPVRPYAIPYRSLVPRYEECVNLVVPVCMSASHVAFASIRMEPQYMILGHAAGVAAAQAATAGLPVQQLPILGLQRALLDQRQVLEVAA
ncbi:MAG TPA: FAD-dependent oxidoreductase [Herpetosiphonaceae bacterium]|nr:FAD-dependent oxidoreductase [Herpetosiphonaceae bacterium]